MSLARALRGALLVTLLALSSWTSASAQGTVQIILPSESPLPAAPRIAVRTAGFPAALGQLQIRLRLSLTSGFGLILYDSTKSGSEASFTMTPLLPENRDIFAEAAVFDQAGNPLQTVLASAGRTGSRLQLLDPDGLTGVSLNTQQPRFSWRSAPVTSPPGPWVYELYVTNVATQETRSRGGIADTIYQYPDTLEANTSYRWRVVARPLNGLASDSATVSSRSSFVIAPANQPVTTLLYQNFPNPFPAPSSQTTCIWFDLRTATEVRLMIHDLRGNPVRTIVPSAQFAGTLPAGRYGRLRDADGCDPRFAWDGSADDGRVVQPGVYLVRLKADGYESIRKIVFRGR
ncbi:MAG: hypothetical protein JWL95_682 [Gemmatimonadetes bacterium]|nr:hypothetical protein [Gemmatimonadota bacterium]